MHKAEVAITATTYKSLIVGSMLIASKVTESLPPAVEWVSLNHVNGDLCREYLCGARMVHAHSVGTISAGCLPGCRARGYRANQPSPNFSVHSTTALHLFSAFLISFFLSIIIPDVGRCGSEKYRFR